MSKGRNRGRGGRRERDLTSKDPITGTPKEPEKQPGLVTGTYTDLFDAISGTSWFRNSLGARSAALQYGYDGGAIEYFVHAPTLFHYQYGTMVQVYYMTAPGVVTGGLIFPDSQVTFALDSALV